MEKVQKQNLPVSYTHLDVYKRQGSITSFMDRSFYSASTSGKSEIFRYKPAAAVISARRAGTTATYDQLNKY